MRLDFGPAGDLLRILAFFGHSPYSNASKPKLQIIDMYTIVNQRVTDNNASTKRCTKKPGSLARQAGIISTWSLLNRSKHVYGGEMEYIRYRKNTIHPWMHLLSTETRTTSSA